MDSDLRVIPESSGSDRTGADEDPADGTALADLGIVALAPDETITPLGALLVERGDLSGQQLRDALGAQTSQGKRLGEILVELGVISERVLSSALAEQVGLEAVDLSRARPDVAIVGMMTEDEARSLGALPLRKVGGRIDVAIADPLDQELQIEADRAAAQPGAAAGRAAGRRRLRDRPRVPRTRPRSAVRSSSSTSARRRRGVNPATNEPEVAVDENAPIVKVVNLIFEQARARPRVRRAHRAPTGSGAGPGPHRRRAARGAVAARIDGHGAGQPDQGHGRHEHRRAAPARRTARSSSRSTVTTSTSGCRRRPRSSARSA